MPKIPTRHLRLSPALARSAAGTLACAVLACFALSACGASQNSGAKTPRDAKGSPPPGTALNARASENASRSVPSEAAVSAVAALASSSTPGPGSGRVVASVAGLKITLGELRHRMATMRVNKQEVPEPPAFAACVAHQAGSAAGKSPAQLRSACKARYEELKREALDSLIDARWITLEARSHGLRPDEAALDAEVAHGLKVAAKVGQTLALTGQTVTDAKYWQRINQDTALLHKRIDRLTPKVTPQRIARYYAQNKARYAVPERRDLRLIRTDSLASARRVLHEIRSGRSFQSVVAELTTHQPIHTAKGFAAGLSYRDYAEPHLSNAIFKARPFVLEGPIRLDASNSPKAAFGYYVFEVLRIHPPRQQSLAQVRASIAAQLPEELHELTLKDVVAAFKHKWRSRTDCRAGYVVQTCRQYSGKRFEDLFTL